MEIVDCSFFGIKRKSNYNLFLKISVYTKKLCKSCHYFRSLFSSNGDNDNEMSIGFGFGENELSL